ncbi:MAG: hypothetical protein WAQ05_18280, partial [Rubrivivax sp.]
VTVFGRAGPPAAVGGSAAWPAPEWWGLQIIEFCDFCRFASIRRYTGTAAGRKRRQAIGKG